MKMHICDKPNVPPSPCPHCGYVMDHASGIETEALPVPGKSCGLCIQCGAVNGYDEQLRLVALDPMKLLRIELDEKAGPKLKAVIRAWRATMAQFGRKQRPLDGGIRP